MAKFSKKEKAKYFAAKSKKGAVSQNGAVLSDFQRGRNFGRAEQIGQERGQHAYRSADEAGKEALRQKQIEYAEKRQKRFEAWCVKQQKKAAKQAAKAGKK